MADSERSTLTEGGLAWPIVVFQLLQVTYNLADTLWLGRLSDDAVGAISLAFPHRLRSAGVGSGGLTRFTTVKPSTGILRSEGA